MEPQQSKAFPLARIKPTRPVQAPIVYRVHNTQYVEYVVQVHPDCIVRAVLIVVSARLCAKEGPNLKILLGLTRFLPVILLFSLDVLVRISVRIGISARGTPDLVYFCLHPG